MRTALEGGEGGELDTSGGGGGIGEAKRLEKGNFRTFRSHGLAHRGF